MSSLAVVCIVPASRASLDPRPEVLWLYQPDHFSMTVSLVVVYLPGHLATSSDLGLSH